MSLPSLRRARLCGPCPKVSGRRSVGGNPNRQCNFALRPPLEILNPLREHARATFSFRFCSTCRASRQELFCPARSRPAANSCPRLDAIVQPSQPRPRFRFAPPPPPFAVIILAMAQQAPAQKSKDAADALIPSAFSEHRAADRPFPSSIRMEALKNKRSQVRTPRSVSRRRLACPARFG